MLSENAVDSGKNTKVSWLMQKWQHVKHEAKHYWIGTKLLGTEIMICVRILRQVLFESRKSKSIYLSFALVDQWPRSVIMKIWM